MKGLKGKAAPNAPVILKGKLFKKHYITELHTIVRSFPIRKKKKKRQAYLL